MSHQALEVLIRELVPEPEYDGLLASGSLVEGFGNKSSDIDLFLLTDGRDLGNRAFSSDLSRYIDVTSVDRPSVVAWTMEISRGTEGCGEAWLPRSYLPFGTLETLHRLSISIPLGSHSPMETLGPVLLEHLPLRVAVSFYRDATAYWSDLIGAHLSEDFEQVGQLDRLVHQAVIASLAALRGETGTGVKWLQKRVQRAGLLDNPSWRAAMAPSSPRDGRESLDAIGRVHLALGRNAAELAGGRDLPDPPPGLDALSRREVDPDGQWYECSLFNGRRLLKP